MLYLIITIVAFFIIFSIISLCTYSNLNSLQANIENSNLYINNKLNLFIKSLEQLILISKNDMEYEKEIFIEMEKQIKILLSTDSILQKANSKQAICDNINSIFDLSEAYLQLSTSNEFIKIKNDLIQLTKTLDNEIDIYNDYVAKYNKKINKFPYKLIIKLFNFEKKDLFTPIKQKEKSIQLDI